MQEVVLRWDLGKSIAWGWRREEQRWRKGSHWERQDRHKIQGGIKERERTERKKRKVRAKKEGWKIRTRFSEVGTRASVALWRTNLLESQSEDGHDCESEESKREEWEQKEREINEGQSLQELSKIRTYCLLLMIGSQTLWGPWFFLFSSHSLPRLIVLCRTVSSWILYRFISSLSTTTITHAIET